jgi:ABC-type transport system involved in multi-copper enzyme maturation permease subunit
MFKVFFAEWRKLRRPTLFLGTFGAALAFTALITSVTFLLIDSEMGNGDRGTTIGRETLVLANGSVFGFQSVGGLLGIIALCVFAAQTAQEYTYGTLRNLLVRQPRRLVLMFGKFAAMKTFALLLILSSAIFSIGISVALSGGAEVSTAQWFTSDGWSEIGKALLNVYISVVLFALIGIILGLLLRSPISSISIGVIWILIVESIIGLVKPSTLDWLPGNQLSTIAMGGSPDLSYTHALTLGSIYVAVGLVISLTLFARRDVAN